MLKWGMDDVNGIIPLFKPKGLTSHDCVHKIRKLTKCKKVGHTGTLDPNVEGVLPICLGEATKIIPFLQQGKKVYIADVFLGKATTTEDSDGEVISEKVVGTPPTNSEIDRVLKMFTGEIEQKPPMYSAVKVKGKRLYEYARKNIDVERPVRTVTIYDLKRIPTGKSESHNSFRIQVTCSKGTYIRTLCVDIGKELGYPSHMSFLERTESDTFSLSDTVTFSELENALEQNTLDTFVLPIERGLQHLPSLNVSTEMKHKVLQGQKLPIPSESLAEPFVMMHKNKLLAIYEYHKQNRNEIKPVRVFNIHKGKDETDEDD